MCTALNIPARVAHNEVYSVDGDQAPSFRTARRWKKWFREGREEVEDEARPGRPITKIIYGNIEQVRLLIDDDRYMTIEQMQEQTGLNYGITQRIIFNHLQLTKNYCSLYS
ncbi:unnamed protein product [Rotaria sp. Silwood1]|nr:unnamed protein product [Rotaria sp. Silwood1]CAF3893537.1 unnamed protein product [Rotaria sp. Silwood1]CAF3895052.1 unnamed protein product [Rotaria sp. Silwood1]CAF4938961.1 unnamed protein product [Rotaria sp. Silwood1]CAF4952842.1 unnamed protein product [Rotaria sp. Silwood1]